MTAHQAVSRQRGAALTPDALGNHSSSTYTQLHSLSLAHLITVTQYSPTFSNQKPLHFTFEMKSYTTAKAGLEYTVYIPQVSNSNPPASASEMLKLQA